jgi:hypothetical protein
MQFQPKTPEEFEAERAAKQLQPGEYSATVATAIETQGTYGPQFQVELTVFTDDGEKKLKDWIGCGSEKLFHFCNSADIVDVYNGGSIDAEDLEGRDVSVKVGMGKPRPDGKVFPRVDGYLPRQAKKPATPAARPTAREAATARKPANPVSTTQEFTDSDIPF